MSQTLKAVLGVALVAAMGPARASFAQSEPPAAPQDPGFSSGYVGPQQVSFDRFYQELSPYGAWVQCDPYGWVWLPADVDASWEPYTTGYWGYSDWGYAWYPDEVWGWAPFHYGNWMFTPAYGWAWVPGYTWGGGFVSWWYGAGYVGWAPLPPRYYYGYHHDTSHPDVRNDVTRTVDPKHYVVVPESSFANTHVTSVMRRPGDVGGAFQQMKAVDRLPTLVAQRNPVAPPRQMSPGARDIARIDQTSPSAFNQSANRIRPIPQPGDARARDSGQTATQAVPRFSATPRTSSSMWQPNPTSRAYTVPSGSQVRPIAPAMPRVMPAMPRSMPAMQPRIAPSGPVMRSMPAPRTMPSGGARSFHMPAIGRHR